MLSTMAVRQRIVAVTGIGAVSPLGLSFVDSWQALLNRKSGATSLEEAIVQHQGLQPASLLDEELRLARNLPCQVVAPVKGFASPSADFGKRTTARFLEFALKAATEAVQQAGMADYLTNATDEQRSRIGVSMGSGMSSVREVAQAYKLINPPIHNEQDTDTSNVTQRRPYRRLSPHFVPKVLTNSASGRISMLYGGLWGPNLAPSTACAAGAHALGHAWQAIAMGQADVMLAGGTEAAVDPLSLAGFCQLRALSTQFNDRPAAASRPFDSDRDGFVLAEGAAVLVLEEWQHAQQRGVKSPLAILSGYGASGDGFHVTAPDAAGRGAIRAMRGALGHRQFDAGTVQYVNAHSTSTPKGDEIEARAIAECLGNTRDREAPVWVSSTKGSTGHLLGAAGALEAAFTVQALVDQVLPPTLNLESLEDCNAQNLEHVRDVKKVATGTLRSALTNSFGFGGTNASLLFEAPEAATNA